MKRLAGVIQRYDWGDSTALAEILGGAGEEASESLDASDSVDATERAVDTLNSSAE